MRKSKKELFIDVTLGIILGSILVGFLYLSDNLSFLSDVTSSNKNSAIIDEPKSPQTLFGYEIEKHYFQEDRVLNNQILGSILFWEGVPYSKIDKLATRSKEVFDVKMIRPKRKLTFVRKDSCGPLQSVIYEPDKMSYVIYNVADSVFVQKVIRPVETKVEFASGTVTSSLWNSMKDNNLNISLIDKMEDALSSEVDFYHAQKGDKYKLLYERKYINDEPVATGKLIGAYYNNNKARYAVYFESDDYKGYYNYEGQATKKAFLRAPVRFSRISSGFNRGRFHPILHKIKAHYGTDYAAPYGTPIMAVASGTIVRKGYGKNNGNYITIKHDKQYTTTYLHMQRFAKGISKGVFVTQGQTIGYIGSTGLATGPHVCFRMKKNGSPINHRRENFPSPDPLPDSLLNNYYIVRDSILNILNELSVETLLDSGMVNLEKSDSTRSDNIH